MQGERLGEETTAGKLEGLQKLREAAAHPASDKAVEQGDTWHVAFYGKKNEAKATIKPAMALSSLPADSALHVR